MIGDVLTKAEVQELTDCRQRAACIRILVREKVPFVVAADGWPRVRRDWIPGGNVVSLPSRDEREPDFDALAS